MSTILSFRDLEVWQLGMKLVVDVYRETEGFPPTERYGLTSQIRRAAVSIPSNVAEGHARRSDGAYLNHVRIALGSQAELGTELEVASRLGYLSAEVSHHADRARRRGSSNAARAPTLAGASPAESTLSCCRWILSCLRFARVARAPSSSTPPIPHPPSPIPHPPSRYNQPLPP